MGEGGCLNFKEGAGSGDHPRKKEHSGWLGRDKFGESVGSFPGHHPGHLRSDA